MLSAEHTGPLLVIAGVIPLALMGARRLPQDWIDPVAAVLAASLVLAEAWWWMIAIVGGTWTVQWNLPLHLCEAACFVGAIGLWRRNRFAFEITYFWVLGGSLPGLFTPNIPGHFPDPVYFQYYAEHGLLVLGSLYMVAIMRMRPAKGAVLRVCLATIAYAIPVGAVDYVTDGNYLFLRSLPPTRTLLDYMGPWPWYLVTLTALAVVVFTLLYLPFATESRRETQAESPA